MSSAGRNKVTEAIEAWRALSDEHRRYFLDRTYRHVGGPARDAALALLRAAAEPEAKDEHRRSAQAESCPSPKMNADERQCDGCGIVFPESYIHEDLCMDCACGTPVVP